MTTKLRESVRGAQKVTIQRNRLRDTFKLIWEVGRKSHGLLRKGVTNTSRESTNTRLLTVMMDEASKTTKKMEETSFSLATVTTSPQFSTSSKVWKRGTSVTFRGTGTTPVSEWSCSDAD